MSTRSQIYVEGTGVYIYKHSDGYLEGVLPTLEPFVKFFLKERGWDPDYLAAQIVREFGREELGPEVEERAKRLDTDPAKIRAWASTLGWGLGTSLHGDEKYIYLVKPNCIEVREPTGKYREAPSLKRTRRTKSIRTIPGRTPETTRLAHATRKGV